jgi:hypothetical protein
MYLKALIYSHKIAFLNLFISAQKSKKFFLIKLCSSLVGSQKESGILGSTLCDGVCQTAGKPLSCSVPTIIRKINGAFPGYGNNLSRLGNPQPSS